MKKGSFDYKVDEREILVCRWLSSRVVNICCNAVGVEPVTWEKPKLGHRTTRHPW